MANTFGEYIRLARIEKGVGQRELARQLGVSPSYLNDIEQAKRSAPRLDLLKSIKELLSIEEEKFYDLAGFSKDKLPPDIDEYLLDNTEALSLVRMLKNVNLSPTKISDIKLMITSQNYSAVIVAAGLGSRLKGLTKDTPKCMLELNGKSILQHQIDSFSENGISEISVIRGYKKNKINLDGLRYFENDDFQNNNILNSIFYAEKAIDGNVIISYSDIVFASNCGAAFGIHR